jgi:hypothetical protein
MPRRAFNKAGRRSEEGADLVAPSGGVGLAQLDQPAQVVGLEHDHAQEVVRAHLLRAEAARQEQKAIGIQSQVGFYQFWTFDLANRRVASRTEFRGRPRMGLTIGSGGDVLYIHTAGHTIDIYDANSFQLRRTVELPDDMTTLLLIPPG